jgi:hypothetical protein
MGVVKEIMKSNLVHSGDTDVLRESYPRVSVSYQDVAILVLFE